MELVLLSNDPKKETPALIHQTPGIALHTLEERLVTMLTLTSFKRMHR